MILRPVALLRLFALGPAAQVPPRAPRRRARAALLWGAGLAVAASLILAVLVDTALPQLRDPEYGYRSVRVHKQQRLHPDRPLVLVLGTSRTQNAVNPEAMELADEPGTPLVFNFGQAGSHPLHQRLSLQRLFAEGVRPAAVAVEICPPTLAIPGPADHLFFPTRLTETDLHRLRPYLDDPAGLRRRWAVRRLNVWQTHGQLIVSHLVPQWLPWQMRLDFQWNATNQFGFTPYPMSGVDERRAQRQEWARAEHSAALARLRVSELAIRAYRDLLADCRDRGVRVAFFLMPESPLFRSWYSAESRATIAAFARTLRDELGCPVFEAPADYNEEDFADGHHMLPPAAPRFSRWLADTHLKPWVVGGR